MQNLIDKIRGAWRSKTIWLNAAAGLALANSDQLLSLMPQLQPVLLPEHYQRTMTILTIANVGLRFITKTPLEAK